jgi:hypothetical protein
MGDIVNLKQWKDESEPHLKGYAKCLACNHKWIAIVPVGVSEFECPNCGSFKGVYQEFVIDGPEIWVCQYGCDIFRITPDYIYCVNCGTEQTFPG